MEPKPAVPKAFTDGVAIIVVTIFFAIIIVILLGILKAIAQAVF